MTPCLRNERVARFILLVSCPNKTHVVRYAALLCVPELYGSAISFKEELICLDYLRFSLWCIVVVFWMRQSIRRFLSDVLCFPKCFQTNILAKRMYYHL